MNATAVTKATERTVAEWKNPLWTLLEVVRNLRSLGLIAVVGLPAVLFFSGLGVLNLSRRQPLFVAITLTHIPLTLICLLLLSFRIWPRYFFIDLAFVFVFLVQGVFVFAGYLARSVGIFEKFSLNAARLGVLGSFAAVLCSLVLLPPNYRYPKQDFLGARDFVEAERTPGDAVASIGLASYAYSRYYAPAWQVADSWRELDEIRRQAQRTWLVFTSTAHMGENYSDVMTGLPSEFELVRQFPGSLGDGSVFVYRSRVSVGASVRFEE